MKQELFEEKSQPIDFPIDYQKKETINYQEQMLHYGIYAPPGESCFRGDIPWHWHEEFEFGYMCGGSMFYQTNHEQCILEEGDGIFINSGALHYLHPLDPLKKVRLQSQFIDSSFLSGNQGNLIDLRYIAPVREQAGLEMIPLHRKDPSHSIFLDKLQEAAKLGIKRERFFELRIRSIFAELWEEIYAFARKQKENDRTYNLEEDERIKRMLLYIQEHASAKISVKEIAAAVPISERECFRLFQNRLGITPVEYVISMRLQKAQELLRKTDQSILEIALETGFSGSSYFGKLFREHHHITPKEYRNTMRKISQG